MVTYFKDIILGVHISLELTLIRALVDSTTRWGSVHTWKTLIPIVT